MKQLLIIASLTLLALVWLTEFIHRLLAVLWPVAALGLCLVAASAALSASVRILASGLRTLRPAPVPVEVIPPDTDPRTFSRTVQNIFTDPHAHTDRWNTALLQFVFVGDLESFSVRRMARYIGRSDREKFIRLLTNRQPPIMLSDERGTRWAPGWNRHLLRVALKRDLLSLPYPDADPPAVNMAPLGRHTQHAQHTHPAQSSQLVYVSPMRSQ